MRYYTTLRIELIADNDERAIEMASSLSTAVQNIGNINGSDVIYVTKQDGLESKTLIDNLT